MLGPVDANWFDFALCEDENEPATQTKDKNLESIEDLELETDKQGLELKGKKDTPTSLVKHVKEKREESKPDKSEAPDLSAAPDTSVALDSSAAPGSPFVSPLPLAADLKSPELSPSPFSPNVPRMQRTRLRKLASKGM